MVLAASEREKQGQQGPTPKAKDAKKLELFGQKVYSTRGSNFELEISRLSLVDMPLTPVSQWRNSRTLPLDSKPEFVAMVKEEKVVTKTLLQKRWRRHMRWCTPCRLV